MVHCCVPFCKNSSKNTDAVSFHTFPSRPDLRKQWVINIRRDPGRKFNLCATTAVCSDHFKPGDFISKGYTTRRRLQQNAVPTEFSWTCQSQQTERWSRAMNRKPLSEVGNSTGKDVVDNGVGLAVYTASDNSISPGHGTTEESENWPAPSFDHDYHIAPQDVRTQLDSALLEIQRLSEEVVHLKTERSLYCRLSRDPELVKFYTGFRDYHLLMTFYQSIEPTASNMKRYTQHRRLCNRESKTSRISMPHEDIPLVDQFLLVLRKLRVGTYDQELADLYGVSVPTVSRIVITWVNFLYFMLGSQPLWPTKKQVQDHMPDIFKDEYSNTRVILDCTEIRIQTPSSLVLNSEFYSHYKSHNTMKSLIGISPSGAVIFVSSIFPGSLSDKAITRISGILDLIEDGDEVMVDKGFVIQDLLEPFGAKLVIPPFLTDKRSQFSSSEVCYTQSIARLRIHVERAIRRVKCYHIFDKVIPLTLAGTVNQMWSVCCLLTNFCGDLF